MEQHSIEDADPLPTTPPPNCQRWGCGTSQGTLPRYSYQLLGKTVWLHQACAASLGEDLLELINRMEKS